MSISTLQNPTRTTSSLPPLPPSSTFLSGGRPVPASISLKGIVTMFLEVDISANVSVPPEGLHGKGLLLQRSIIYQILDDIAKKKATKDHGYYVCVTNLARIGEGMVRELTGDVLFPVSFSCVTFKPITGEVLRGKVDKVMKTGVFLNCGPIENIFLSNQAMAGYHFVSGDNPMFLNNKHSKIVKDSEMRFKVLGWKWDETQRGFMVLGTLDGDYLGPVSD